MDKAALVALYNATDGPNWTNNSNWLTNLVAQYGKMHLGIIRHFFLTELWNPGSPRATAY